MIKIKKTLVIYVTVLLLILVGCKQDKINSTTQVPTEPATTQLEKERGPLDFPKGFGWWSNDKDIKFVRQVAQLTGQESINKTFTKYGFGRIRDGLFGTDLGIPVYDGEKMYLFFGDTLDINVWESNAVAFSADFDLDDGLLFDGMLTDQYGKVKSVIQGKHDHDIPDGVNGATRDDGREVTKIPTGGIAIDGAVYMHFMSIREWEHWYVNYNAVVKSTDGGKTWNLVPNLVWDQDEAPNFGQIFPVEDKDNPDLVYLFAIPGNRDGAVKLARVLKKDYEIKSKYEYFTGLDETGNPEWVLGDEGLRAIKDNEDSIVIPGPNGELSVIYNPYLGKWLYTTLNHNGIVFRLGDNPWGPWTKDRILVPHGKFDAGIYGAFMHEMYTSHDGQRVFFIMSKWEPYYNSYLMEVVFR